jgi:predicted Zn-dependent peptidase
MGITAKQAQQFARMKFEQNMEMPDYLAHYSKEFLGKMVKKLSDLTEAEAEEWIRQYNKKKS